MVSLRADILRGLKGRFLLSINARPEVRETFAGFTVEEVETRYSANAKAARRVGELLIGGGGGLAPRWMSDKGNSGRIPSRTGRQIPVQLAGIDPIVDRPTIHPEPPRQLRLRDTPVQIVLQQHPGLPFVHPRTDPPLLAKPTERPGTPCHRMLLSFSSLWPKAQNPGYSSARRVPATGELFVLWDGTGLVVKRVEPAHEPRSPKLRLVSVNPAYPTYAALVCDVHVVGKVLWKFTRARACEPLPVAARQPM